MSGSSTLRAFSTLSVPYSALPVSSAFERTNLSSALNSSFTCLQVRYADRGLIERTFVVITEIEKSKFSGPDTVAPGSVISISLEALCCSG